ncbi:hypothetical protein E4U21_004715 [Claviceps maximensis]|nr:hypothetical protein E4U21_004715 [Claviceps maximensis]
MLLPKIVFAAGLISSACAVPYSSHAAWDKTHTNSTSQSPASTLVAKNPRTGVLMPSDDDGNMTKIISALPAKKPRTGVLMPSGDDGNMTRTIWARSRLSRKKEEKDALAAVKRFEHEQVTNRKIANFYVSKVDDGNGDGQDKYVMYYGKGGAPDGWPPSHSWVSFENMFRNYRAKMMMSCSGEYPHQTDNTESEINAIYDGIQRASGASGVDHRFVLAILMQESYGCVRSPSTNYGIRRAGMMQSYDGDFSCNEGIVQYPCPEHFIWKMIDEAVAGSRHGEGLAGCLNRIEGDDASVFYKAARLYNSGFISTTKELQNGVGSHCYASDIAK